MLHTESCVTKQSLTNQLTNLAENDEYKPCEGEISMRCFTAANKAWDSHSNDLQVFLAYIDCYGEESAKCPFPIAQHMNAIIQAFKKHLKEKYGLLGGMVEQIKQ